MLFLNRDCFHATWERFEFLRLDKSHLMTKKTYRERERESDKKSHKKNTTTDIKIVPNLKYAIKSLQHSISITIDVEKEKLKTNYTERSIQNDMHDKNIDDVTTPQENLFSSHASRHHVKERESKYY